jgi:hypothetical protein
VLTVFQESTGFIRPASLESLSRDAIWDAATAFTDHITTSIVAAIAVATTVGRAAEFTSTCIEYAKQ